MSWCFSSLLFSLSCIHSLTQITNDLRQLFPFLLLLHLVVYSSLVFCFLYNWSSFFNWIESTLYQVCTLKVKQLSSSLLTLFLFHLSLALFYFIRFVSCLYFNGGNNLTQVCDNSCYCLAFSFCVSRGHAMQLFSLALTVFFSLLSLSLFLLLLLFSLSQWVKVSQSASLSVILFHCRHLSLSFPSLAV